MPQRFVSRRLLVVATSALIALFLPKALSLAEEVAKAAEVAQKVGQTVTFQDEVKAVSFSRSTRGYYLSFGAPYPQQVLSVWVAEKLYDQLPFAHKLVDRTVRITGVLESSPTGPLLKIDSLDQLAVVEMDEAVVSQLILDGRRDRHKFQAAVQQIFAREDFQTLEKLAEELRQSQERTADGDWLLNIFFTALHVAVNAPDEDYTFTEGRLANWAKARPESLVLTLMQAQFHRDLAWHAVKSGSWRSVNSDTRKVYRKEIALSRQILEGHPAEKIYPPYFDLMLDVAICQRWPRANFFRLLEEATTTYPEDEFYYLRGAEYLLHYWGGKKGEWEAYAEKERRRFGASGAGDALYARIGWSMVHRYRNLFRETAISWEEMASGFDYLIKQHPDSNYLKNAYANLAWRADDRVRLRKLLAEIKSNPDMEIWVNLENVALAENFAVTDSGR